MDTLKIGNFLQALRRAKGLTQQELADYLLVSSKTISKWETGVSLPELPMLVTLAEYYDVTVDDILSGQKRSINNSSTNEIAKTRVNEKFFLARKTKKLDIIAAIAYLMGVIAIVILLIVAAGTKSHIIGGLVGIIILVLAASEYVIFTLIFGRSDSDFSDNNVIKFKKHRFCLSYWLTWELLVFGGFAIVFTTVLSLYRYFYLFVVAGVIIAFLIAFLAYKFLLYEKYSEKPSKLIHIISISERFKIGFWVIFSFSMFYILVNDYPSYFLNGEIVDFPSIIGFIVKPSNIYLPLIWSGLIIIIGLCVLSYWIKIIKSVYLTGVYGIWLGLFYLVMHEDIVSWYQESRKNDGPDLLVDFSFGDYVGMINLFVAICAIIVIIDIVFYTINNYKRKAIAEAMNENIE